MSDQSLTGQEPSGIYAFDGEFAFLSNFHVSPFAAEIVGPLREWFHGQVRFDTVEHWFQAHKAITPSDFGYIASCPTPGSAKRTGRSIRIREDWDDVKVEVMRLGLAYKFALDSDLALSHLALRLLATGDRELVEGNTWGDMIWGKVFAQTSADEGMWVGENLLGRLLMERRDQLRSG